MGPTRAGSHCPWRAHRASVSSLHPCGGCPRLRPRGLSSGLGSICPLGHSSAPGVLCAPLPFHRHASYSRLTLFSIVRPAGFSHLTFSSHLGIFSFWVFSTDRICCPCLLRRLLELAVEMLSSLPHCDSNSTTGRLESPFHSAYHHLFPVLSLGASA